MAFKAPNSGRSNAPASNEPRDFPVPRAGSRKARVSLIVDLGIQDREDFEDPKTGEVRPQKPAPQVAVFADLVADTVDYGGDIGKAHYRLMLNKSFQGEITGITFQAVAPRDAKGNIIEGKPYGLHPASPLTKLAKAVGKPEIIESTDIEALLGEAFMAQVEVRETEGKRKDAEGNPIIYKNVNYKGATPIPEDDDGNPVAVAELNVEPLCITFDSARKEDIKFIRASLITKIKQANNYAGSKMQKAIEAYEAANGTSSGDDEQEEEAPAPKKSAPKSAAKPKAKPVEIEEDEDVPF